MRIAQLFLMAVSVSVSSVVLADAPFATASFTRRDPESAKSVPITSARIDDRLVCIAIRDVSTSDGDHSLRLVIYDGAGREVYQSLSTITAKDKKWQRTICYGFNRDHDTPGTWWYVAELDDQPLVTKEIVIAPLSAPGGG